MLDLLGC